MSDRSVSIVEWSAIVAIIAIDAIFAANTGIGIRRGRRLYRDVCHHLRALAGAGSADPGDRFREGRRVSRRGGGEVADLHLCRDRPPRILSRDLAGAVAGRSADPRRSRRSGSIGRRCSPGSRRIGDVRKVIAFAYFNLANEAILVLLVTALFYPMRARQVPTALILSSLMTVPMLWVFPVAGAFVAFDHVSLPHASFTADYLGMRAHALAQIPLDDPRGIISFPSFHASSAVLLTYLVRGIPVLYPAMLLFNGLMVLGTPVFGGHYLVDVLAGLAVAGLTIAILEGVDLGKELSRVALFPRFRSAPSTEAAALDEAH